MISKASRHHTESIIHLLKESKLPFEDIALDRQTFFVSEENNKLVASCAIERYKEYGLLRSLAVKNSHRNRGLGLAIYSKAIEYCKEEGIKSLFLLTTTARDFFLKIGWKEISRMAAPNNVQESKEFKSICPESATCMMYIFKQTPAYNAFDTYEKGYNCAQAVLSGFAEEYNLPKELALKMTSGLAAGIGFNGSICGTVLGAYLTIGLKYGRAHTNDDLAKETTYLKMRQFDKMFTEQHNSIYCSELLKGNVGKETELDDIIKKGYFDNACPVYIHTAGTLLEKILK